MVSYPAQKEMAYSISSVRYKATRVVSGSSPAVNKRETSLMYRSHGT